VTIPQTGAPLPAQAIDIETLQSAAPIPQALPQAFGHDLPPFFRISNFHGIKDLLDEKLLEKMTNPGDLPEVAKKARTVAEDYFAQTTILIKDEQYKR